MRNQLKLFLLIVATFLLFLMTYPPQVQADGAVYHDNYLNSWLLLQRENQQLCAIHYQDGSEKMILVIDVDDLSRGAGVWIFPVPADPDEIKIGIINSFPKISGESIYRKSEEQISHIFRVILGSQIYTIPFMKVSHMVFGGVNSINLRQTERVIVHEHIEKEGLTTEVITAENEEAIYQYLNRKRLNLSDSLKSSLSEYTNKNYSFVVSWISNFSKVDKEYVKKYNPYPDGDSSIGYNKEKLDVLSVFVIFPTNKIYFPLKMTSVYGNQTIPILIYVMQPVTPEIYPKIENYTSIDYFISDNYFAPEELSKFFSNEKTIRNLEYTRIEIFAPSKYFVKDLWMEKSPPIKVIKFNCLKKYGWLFGIIIFTISSCLSSLLAGISLFEEDVVNKKKLIQWGLWNFLTLIGFSIATIFLRTKRLKPELEKRLESEKIIIWDNRKIQFVMRFTMLFVITNLILFVISLYLFGS